MIPIADIEEIREIDRSSQYSPEVLIERAGAAVARSALRELGGAYGRRVVVVAGKGSNGEDGRVAARRLQRRGVRVHLFDADESPEELDPPPPLLLPPLSKGNLKELPLLVLVMDSTKPPPLY